MPNKIGGKALFGIDSSAIEKVLERAQEQNEKKSSYDSELLELMHSLDESLAVIADCALLYKQHLSHLNYDD